MAKLLGLRIDVDTYQGALYGLPTLLKILEKHQVTATFFIPGGPDESAKALKRIFIQKGYLTKLIRSRAYRMYSPKTIVSGLLGGSKRIVDIPLLASLPSLGHEIGIHGLGHTSWHNDFLKTPPRKVRKQMVQALEAVKRTTGVPPICTAGPGWQGGFTSFAVNDDLQFDFAADTRGHCPFLPQVNGFDFSTPQIPTTLPTLDELPGGLLPTPQDTTEILHAILQQPFPVYTAHTEMEGGPYPDFLESLLTFCEAKRIAVVPLSTLLEHARKSDLPRCVVAQRPIPGRPGTVAFQIP